MADCIKEVTNLVIGIGALVGVLIFGVMLTATCAFIYDQFWPPKAPPTRDGELFDSAQVVDGTGHICEKQNRE